MRNKRAKSLRKLVQGDKLLYKIAKRIWTYSKSINKVRKAICQEQ